MAVDTKKKIILLVSKSIEIPNLDFANDILVNSLKDMGYDVDVVIFSEFYDLINILKSAEPVLVFNLFQNTSDDISTQMHIVGVLEILEIPYIGHDPFVLGLSNMKNFVKRLLENKRIPSIPYQIYREIPKSTYLDFPVILRPTSMDWPRARIQEKKIFDFKTLKNEVTNNQSQYHHPILVESFIPGRIFMVGIFGNENSQVLPVCESVPIKNTYRFECPANIDWDTSIRFRDIALHVFKYLMGKDYALISFLMDKENEIYVADYHPNPSLLADSVFQLGFDVSDYEFKDFLQLIINETLKKKSYGKN
jgi:D-alanine-D-alanine ligase-like ATP-grasp enzyme